MTPAIKRMMFLALIGILLLIVAVIILSSPRIGEKPEISINSPVGQTKLIRVGDKTARNDLPVFTTKDALIRFMRAASKNDGEGMLATLPDTFRVKDYTSVRIIGYDPIGKGLFNIEVLEGPERSRTGWVMDIDLRNR